MINQYLCTFFCRKLRTALLESAEGRKWLQKIFHDQFSRKNVARPDDLQITSQMHIRLTHRGRLKKGGKLPPIFNPLDICMKCSRKFIHLTLKCANHNCSRFFFSCYYFSEKIGWFTWKLMLFIFSKKKNNKKIDSSATILPELFGLKLFFIYYLTVFTLFLFRSSYMHGRTLGKNGNVPYFHQSYTTIWISTGKWSTVKWHAGTGWSDHQFSKAL